jgi:cell division protein FtsB
MGQLSELLEKPAKVILICLAILTVGIIFDGSLWRLFHLHQNHEILTRQIEEEKAKIAKLNQQLQQLRNPAYIEKQARDRLEFLEKDDLLFVFSED